MALGSGLASALEAPRIMHAIPSLHLFDPAPARGSLSAHRSHAPSLCSCLPHGTRGVACRPRGCSLRRQPMLRKRQQPTVFIAVRSHVGRRDVRLRTRHQALEQARVPESHTHTAYTYESGIPPSNSACNTHTRYTHGAAAGSYGFPGTDGPSSGRDTHTVLRAAAGSCGLPGRPMAA